MAGLPVGATAPETPLFAAATQGAPLHLHASTRTRRTHGVFMVGSERASVHSSRRDGDGLSVTLSIGAGSLVLTGSMDATQARAMARALVAAAVAVEVQQARCTAGQARTLNGGPA